MSDDKPDWRNAANREGHCDAVLPADSLEDEIREAALPEKLPDEAVARIAEYLRANATFDADARPQAASFEIRAKLYEEFLAMIAPAKWTLADSWAIHFAIHSKSCEDVSPVMIIELLGETRQNFSRLVRNWRKKLKMPGNDDLWLRSQQLRRQRKRKPQQKWNPKFARFVKAKSAPKLTKATP